MRKVLLSLISIFLISTVTFFLFEMMPGNIYNVDGIKSEAVINNIIAKYGLDRPVMERYCLMLRNLISFDFGNSFISGQSVKEIITLHFPLSLKMGVYAFAVAVVNGAIIGSVVGLCRSRQLKSTGKIGLVFLYSLPTFEVAALSQYYFCVRLKWFPVLYSGSILIPVIILSLFPTTFIARLLYHCLEEEKKKDYVIAAKLRSVSTPIRYILYELKNSLGPVITAGGSVLSGMIVGSFSVEVIFSIPGLGRHFINAITNRDYPLVMGLTVFYAVILIGINCIAEILVIMNGREVRSV